MEPCLFRMAQSVESFHSFHRIYEDLQFFRVAADKHIQCRSNKSYTHQTTGHVVFIYCSNVFAHLKKSIIYFSSSSVLDHNTSQLRIKLIGDYQNILIACEQVYEVCLNLQVMPKSIQSLTCQVNREWLFLIVFFSLSCNFISFFNLKTTLYV